MSIAILEAVNTTAVQFHGQPIITAMAAGVTYVAMKPIVENLGMSWSTQFRKLGENSDKFNCVHMNMVALDSKSRDVLCIPLKKLNGWLFSINPSKVRADIRDKLIAYQEECFAVLHDYWTKGEVKNKRKYQRQAPTIDAKRFIGCFETIKTACVQIHSDLLIIDPKTARYFEATMETVLRIGRTYQSMALNRLK